MKLKNETLNNSNRYLTGDELDILLGNVHDPCKYLDFSAIVRPQGSYERIVTS